MKLKWQAIDKDGKVVQFTHKPTPDPIGGYWDCDRKPGAFYEVVTQGPKPKDWTKTLEKL